MSASLLNAATPPGASVGVAAHAAQAVQANSPMAGFEALLAAFFGDQGLTGPIVAGQTHPGLAIGLTGQTPPGQALKANGKPGAAGKTDPTETTDATDSDKTPDAPAQAAADAANAALALVAPLPIPAQPIVTAAAAEATETTPEAGLSGKPASSPTLAQLAAAGVAPDGANVANAAKDAGVVAQDTTKAATAPVIAKSDAPPAPQPSLQPLPPPALSDQTPATTAAALPAAIPLATPGAALSAKAPEAPAGAKDKVQTAKAPRVDGARAEAPNLSVAGKAPVGLPTAADDAGQDAAAQEHDPAGPAVADAKPAADNSQPDNAFNLATSTPASANAAALAHAATLVRGSPQTVANLAAQIAKKLDGRSSRFDVQLDPAGLGKVDVRVEIDAAGKMTAAMNFDSQQAANELKSRAGELQRALEQAGFDMSGGMSFDVANQGGQGGAQGQNTGDNNSTSRGRAFQAVLDGAAEADVSQLASYSRTAKSGLDIRI